MPQANSMFSSPRATSPSASPSTLPCSAVSSDAISLRLASTSSRRWNITSLRRDSDVARHVREGGLGGGDREVDLLHRGEVDLGLLLARGRVPDRSRAPGGAVDGLAADPVVDASHCGSLASSAG